MTPSHGLALVAILSSGCTCPLLSSSSTRRGWAFRRNLRSRPHRWRERLADISPCDAATACSGDPGRDAVPLHLRVPPVLRGVAAHPRRTGATNEVVAVYLYLEAFRYNNFGAATATGWIMVLASLVLASLLSAPALSARCSPMRASSCHARANRASLSPRRAGGSSSSSSGRSGRSRSSCRGLHAGARHLRGRSSRGLAPDDRATSSRSGRDGATSSPGLPTA